jgi:putative DNA primase/helicase
MPDATSRTSATFVHAAIDGAADTRPWRIAAVRLDLDDRISDKKDRVGSTMCIHKLLSALAGAGQPYDGELIFNTFIRYGKRKTDTYYWLMIHPVGVDHLAAYFGDWCQGSCHTFKSWENGVRLDGEKAKTLERELDQTRRLQELANQRHYQQAAAQAQAIIDHASIEGQSGYLERKAVGAYGIHFPKPGTIFIPMRDAADTVRGGQWISDDGTKRFLAGTKKKGAFHRIGELDPTGELWLCEGYATGATVYEAVEQPVAVAFDAGNLLAVADDLKALYPELRPVVAADNDPWKDPKRNPGVQAARKVVQKYRARVAIPDFSNVDLGENQPTDWNDLARLIGKRHVKTKLLELKAKVNPLDPLISGAQSTRDPLEIHSKSTRWHGCLLEWSLHGEQTRVIESQAAEMVADGLRDQLTWDASGAFWLVWRGIALESDIETLNESVSKVSVVGSRIVLSGFGFVVR